MTDNEMSWVEHLSEVRKRLIWIILGFVVSMALGLFLAQPVIEHLKNDPAAINISWHVFGISDALRIYMQVSFTVALLFTLPLILYHAWAFVSPGLLATERRAIALYIPFAFLLFLLGIGFGYYGLFPMIITFMTGFTTAVGAEETFGMTQYFQFMFNLILPIALIFELPIVILFLTTLRLITPIFLVKFRKYAIFISVVIAAMISPPDFVSHTLTAIPIILLYELSIWLSKVVYHRQQMRDRLAAAEEEEEFATIITDDE
ncbi:twin-arginine translocase subunit TatC [Ammoniphilus resinae]|uniref:Sec-independent protein translocase protein TatC n=1 Tax=Ammoniphilus resinae TaxID=861532 RepID=A0ABS4GIY0_9BACL|nr:twin-arginine translocase subunit TatC [Ammoniphilus resinae]MBP1930052.1 sec-independent protein translocase protein TatC [Ammoniphilus resinae]